MAGRNFITIGQTTGSDLIGAAPFCGVAVADFALRALKVAARGVSPEKARRFVMSDSQNCGFNWRAMHQDATWRERAHSALTFAALMIGHHFFDFSALRCAKGL